MRPKSYIGVTGFTDFAQVEFVHKQCPGIRHLLMAGVLASSKTLRGETNKWPKRYPPINAMADIFPERVNMLGLIHFHSDGSSSLASELIRIAGFAKKSPGFHGFQLNVSWPNPEHIHTYRHSPHYHIRQSAQTIVLQCGRNAMSEVGNDPGELGKRVADYGSLIDYVLIDPSCGHGKAFDPEFAGDCFEEILRRTGKVAIGVAGGLSAETMHLIEPLLKRRFTFSIDAEGKLRDAEDALDLKATVEYVKAAHALYAQYESAR